jgi:hypothetical protein
MAKFTDDLEGELRRSNENIAEHASSAGSYFESLKSYAENVTAAIQQSIEAISTDFSVSLLQQYNQL